MSGSSSGKESISGYGNKFEFSGKTYGFLIDNCIYRASPRALHGKINQEGTRKSGSLKRSAVEEKEGMSHVRVR